MKKILLKVCPFFLSNTVNQQHLEYTQSSGKKNIKKYSWINKVNIYWNNIEARKLECKAYNTFEIETIVYLSKTKLSATSKCLFWKFQNYTPSSMATLQFQFAF